MKSERKGLILIRFSIPKKNLFFISVYHSLQVILLSHVPPGLFEKYSSLMWFYDKFNTQYVRILQKFSDVITSQIYGHEHTDSYRILKDSNGKPYGQCYIFHGEFFFNAKYFLRIKRRYNFKNICKKKEWFWNLSYRHKSNLYFLYFKVNYSEFVFSLFKTIQGCINLLWYIYKFFILSWNLLPG